MSPRIQSLTSFAVDFVLPDKGESMIDAYHRWRSWADPKVCCDYALHVGVTWWSKLVSDEMKILCEELGINSYKMFMAYKGLYQLNDSDLLDSFERIRALGGIAQVCSLYGYYLGSQIKVYPCHT